MNLMKLPDCPEARIESCEALLKQLNALSATLSEELNALKKELSALKEAEAQTVPPEPVLQTDVPLQDTEVLQPQPLSLSDELLSDELQSDVPQPQLQSEMIPESAEREFRQVTVGERIGQQMAQESLNGRFEARKHADLTKALSLNDRFRFQRELFHGSAAEMTAAMGTLSACESLDEALKCLKEAVGKGEDDPAVKDFLHLLELHFA